MIFYKSSANSLNSCLLFAVHFIEKHSSATLFVMENFPAIFCSAVPFCQSCTGGPAVGGSWGGRSHCAWLNPPHGSSMVTEYEHAATTVSNSCKVVSYNKQQQQQQQQHACRRWVCCILKCLYQHVGNRSSCLLMRSSQTTTKLKGKNQQRDLLPPIKSVQKANSLGGMPQNPDSQWVDNLIFNFMNGTLLSINLHSPLLYQCFWQDPTAIGCFLPPEHSNRP